jgi:hypothetical protein
MPRLGGHYHACGMALVSTITTLGEWTSVFPDAAMTLAAVDRLVHHATIFEMNVESYRRKAAAARTPRKLKSPSDNKRDSEAPRHKAFPASSPPETT